MDGLWMIYGQSMDDLWTVYGQSMACLWMIYGRSMDDLWSLYGQCMDSLWTVYGWSMDDLWTVYCQETSSEDSPSPKTHPQKRQTSSGKGPLVRKVDFAKPCEYCSPGSISPLRVRIKAHLVDSYGFGKVTAESCLNLESAQSDPRAFLVGLCHWKP